MNKQAINPIPRGARLAFLLLGFILVCGIYGSQMAFGALPNLPIDTPAGGSTFADKTADTVLGQPGFTTNAGVATANGMNQPTAVAFDASGRLFVAEETNHRVLVFDNPTSGDTTADTVLGQPNFTSNAAATTSTGMNVPVGVAFDAADRLFVTDPGNNRVLIFNPGGAAAADTTLPVSQVLVVTTGATTFSAPIGSTDTFVQVNLSGGDSTPGDSSNLLAAAKADSIGASFATADYTCTWTLVNSNDSVVMPIWTNQTSLRTFVGLRSDTASIAAANLPPGIPNSDIGRRAFGATAIMVEFADSTGVMLGDSITTTFIGDSFAYNLRYLFSSATEQHFKDLGFDTSAGSSSFRFYFADTYGAAWTHDTTVTVVVSRASAPWSLQVDVVGVTKDLPGGLGGAGSAASSSGFKSRNIKELGCLIERVGAPRPVLTAMRSWRDLALESYIGRLLTAFYYALSSVV